MGTISRSTGASLRRKRELLATLGVDERGSEYLRPGLYAPTHAGDETDRNRKADYGRVAAGCRTRAGCG
jgi:hypothetical protein